MAALPRPEPAARRYAPYIQELREFYASSGLSFGSADGIAPVAERLQSPGSFVDDLSSLIRSIILREGGAVPHAVLLQILVISITGGEIDQPSEQLREPLRGLLIFVTGVLRRPWNEPPTESLPQPVREPPDSHPAHFEPLAETTTPASPVLEFAPGLAAALVAAGPKGSAAFAEEIPETSVPRHDPPSEVIKDQPVQPRTGRNLAWTALAAIPLVLLLMFGLHSRRSESTRTPQPAPQITQMAPQTTIPKPSASVPQSAVSPGASFSGMPRSHQPSSYLSAPGSPFEISPGVMASHLVSAPSPNYPLLARIARLKGQVVLQAVISQDGLVVATRVLSGHRVLRGAAVDAVRRWRYRPYLAEGRPVKVATIVNVDFPSRH
jgi:TonB family protein